MNDLQKGLSILQDTIRNDIKHPDYTRVTTLATEYNALFAATKETIAPYLKKYRKNEDDTMFKQMMEIYETVIPSVVNNLDKMFEKPLRSNRVFSNIDDENNEARLEILTAMQNYWHGETESGVDAYLRERWKYLVTYDPNAFIAVEFSDFNPVKEKPQPFSLEYSSREVIRYEYTRVKTLDWLICEKKIRYKTRTGDRDSFKDGSWFIMYLDDQAVTYTEVDPVQKITDIPDPVFVTIKKENESGEGRVFVQQIWDTKSKMVPAFRVGYELDAVTNNRTVVSNLHHALPFFKKELKSGVELDLTIRAHVFPQKYMYGPKCEGDKAHSKPCNGGKTPNGEKCSVCNGTGTLPVHTTAQDLVVIPIPKSGSDPIIDLTKAMAYFSPPMELVKFMEEYCDRLTEKAKAAIFNQQTNTKKTNYNAQNQPTTATEQDYSWDNVYDTYRPFTAKYSYAWVFIARMIAIYTDNDSSALTIYHRFPNDYKMKPVKELLSEAKEADSSGLPQYVKDPIYQDIANVYYADDQDTLVKITVKNKFHPFSGKSDGEISAIINSPEILPYYKVLYTYFDIIFDQIEEEIGDKFYAFNVKKQREEIDKRVNAFLAQIEKNKATTFSNALQQQEQ